MQTMEVNPPRAAAAVPVAMVSLADCPGSRRWTCKSIKPGTNQFSLCVEAFDAGLRLLRRLAADHRDFPIEQQHVSDGIEGVGGVNYTRASNQKRTHRRGSLLTRCEA